ncbi:glycoside hydrolase family 3 protein [Demequina aurantiaca]|uniref:glycoside hydrolase family 3 protein n=1 Tax=Demequina aurantiaca TaxID=676200 RepID=UPI000782FC37|nr:glycoside hydrolase family 3 N-terminal domain-containing protein [Demequina aurantiaca]
MTDSTTYPYQDATLPVSERVEDLLARLDIEDKAGLMFHTMTGPGDPTKPMQMFPLPSIQSHIVERRMTHFNILGGAPSGAELAAWQNACQEIALSQRWGIPITFSTDPRHHFTDNPLMSLMAGPFSQWPETLGLAAIASTETMQRFGDIARREYLAVGIRVALHPQIDLATEPRWSRVAGTFGEDAELTSDLVEAYIYGFQGTEFGADSVSTMTKHFPGGGAQKDGTDPHFQTGREQVYPAGMFEHHMAPFKRAIAAGTRQMMPYYGMPVGTEYEEVGFSFNKQVITGLLRERLGFDGIVCTDWGLVTDVKFGEADMPARAWGAEHLSDAERMQKIIDAGVDQFGGEHRPELLVELVRDGKVSEERIDQSVRRLLVEKFELGLFENPFADVDACDGIVGNAEFVQAGLDAQSASVTVLKNESVLPLAAGKKIYVEGVDAEVAGQYGTVVESPAEADVALLRVKAPFEIRGEGMEQMFHQGNLEFSAEEAAHIAEVSAAVPTVVDVYLDRAAVLTAIVDAPAAVVANYGCSDTSLLEALTGKKQPIGKLPFDLPRSMAAIEASREDAPFDTENPLFRFGHGLGL